MTLLLPLMPSSPPARPSLSSPSLPPPLPPLFVCLTFVFTRGSAAPSIIGVGLLLRGALGRRAPLPTNGN